MQFKIANRMLACSTLVLGDFYNFELEQFVKKLYGAVGEAESPENKENQYNEWSPNKKNIVQCLDGYAVSKYAFIVATLESEDYQKTVAASLEEFGFTKSEPVWNNKNTTKVALFTISVPKFLEQLEFFRKKFNIKVDEIKVEEPIEGDDYGDDDDDYYEED